MSASGRSEGVGGPRGGPPSTAVALGCFGGSRALERPRELPRRRSSFGWFGRGGTDGEAAAADSAPDSEATVAEALAALQLGEQPAEPAKAGPSKPPPLSAHRRRWSFGRQVAPQPAADADSDGSPVANEAAAAAAAVQDDLLVATSESSFSSITRSSPERAQAARPARQQQGAAPPATPDQQQRQQAGGAPATGAATPQKGQGYRRLWHSITSVRKGDPYPAGGSSGSAEVTVESLVKAVQRLKTGQPVIDAVREGLYSLDSRAVAALLKELSKSGQPQRASELFDWLRALPRDHQLSKLADLYTYTTLISQCGSHQQLRRALELVGEMRSRGIEANIHTYSALMSVCVKCNECDLALDVFQQLLAEGCSPNLVTFNILIDIHGKQGAWAKAVEVLDQLHAQGLTAEPRTYNTIISACSKAGQPGAAARVYERMLADGVQPTGTTYTSLISAFGKAGQVEEALRVYQDMAARGCERNVITYSSLISACERAGRCDIALRLWEEMRREGCRPNVVTYNALIGACAQAGMWAKAAEAFEAMLASGCRPDAVTHSVLISAYERGGQWRRCLQAFEMMQQQGFRPDACVYNVVLEALISSGLVSAQIKAVQLSSAAHRQGHLRLTALNAFESTATAHTYGAAFIATLRWLAELREAPPAAAMPLAFAAGAGLSLGLGVPLQPVSLLLTRGKHCRGDQSYAPIQAALTACFEAFSVPVAAKVTGQGLVLHADAFALTAWLATPSAAALLSPLDAAAAASSGRDSSTSTAGSAALSGALLADDVAADMQCSKAFAAVLEFEASHGMGSSDLLASSPQAAALRQSLISSIVALAASLGVQEETALDAVQLCDRAMASGVAMEAGLAPLYAAAILLLCARQSGEAPHLLEQEIPLAQLIGLPLSTVLEAETHVAAALGGDTGAVSALRVLQLYLERLGCTLLALQKCQLLEVMAVAAVTLARKAALSPAFARVRPSVLAAACLLKAREGLGLAPAWPRTLQSMTAYAPTPGSPLQQCLEVMSLLGLNASLA